MIVHWPNFFEKNNSFETIVFACIFHPNLDINNDQLTAHFILTDHLICDSTIFDRFKQTISINQYQERLYFPNITKNNSKLDYLKWVSKHIKICILLDKSDFMYIKNNNFIWKCSREDLGIETENHLLNIESLYREKFEILTFCRRKL